MNDYAKGPPRSSLPNQVLLMHPVIYWFLSTKSQDRPYEIIDSCKLLNKKCISSQISISTCPITGKI